MNNPELLSRRNLLIAIPVMSLSVFVLGIFGVSVPESITPAAPDDWILPQSRYSEVAQTISVERLLGVWGLSPASANQMESKIKWRLVGIVKSGDGAKALLSIDGAGMQAVGLGEQLPDKSVVSEILADRVVSTSSTAEPSVTRLYTGAPVDASLSTSSGQRLELGKDPLERGAGENRSRGSRPSRGKQQ